MAIPFDEILSRFPPERRAEVEARASELIAEELDRPRGGLIMATGRRSKSYDDLTPEQKARFEAHRARRDEPGVRDAEIRDREAIREERRLTGTVATLDDPAWPDDELRLLKFLAALKAKREGAGLSLADVAERPGIDQAALSRLENGRANPTARTLSRHGHALGGRISRGFESDQEL